MSLLATGLRVRHLTPYLLMDLGTVEANYLRMRAAMPGVGVHYAMKCNPDERILARLHALGCRFEIASPAEATQLAALGVDLAGVLYSNPVKPPTHIGAAYRLGIRHFAFDSVAEIGKLAAHAPMSRVCVRLRTAGASLVPSEGKFGVDVTTAHALMLRARAAGLKPAGIGFHVGSQELDPSAWTRATADAAGLMRLLEADGVRIQLLDLGGGFPARYTTPIPDFRDYARAIRDAVGRYLPYPVRLAVEPGRALVADAGTMVTTIVGRAERAGATWLHLDVGAFNGMMEALETGNRLRFPVTDSKCSPARQRYHLTGPTCDSQDSILFDVELSAGLEIGEHVFVHTAGAYTTCYASRFNGFDIPEIHCAPAAIA